MTATTIALIVLAVNAVLGALQTILTAIAPTTASKLDDEALGVLGWLKKAVDFISANVQH